MKKTIRIAAFFLSLLLLLGMFSGCTGETTPSETTVPEQESTETDANHYHIDREILPDYENIEISGEHDVRILFINAGRADSILIEADGKHYLLDTGEATSVPKITAALEYMGVQKLEAVFLTHSNNDHISGLPMLSELWKIGACYTAAVGKEMSKIEMKIAQTPLTQTLLDPGQVLEISEGLYFEVLGPIRYNPIDDNDNSLVLRMQVNGKTVLFAADMQFDEEKTLMKAGYDLRCDVLKVANHGNKDATSEDFITETSPDYAIITTDRNIDDGTASKRVRTGLENIGAEVLITDEYDLGILCEIAHDGTITMENAYWNPVTEDVTFVEISKDEQSVTLRNDGDEDVDLSRWFIVSSRGGELFMFPEGAVIGAGEKITVGCADSKGEADYKWEDAKVWNQKKDDVGTLIDRHGNIVDEMESE